MMQFYGESGPEQKKLDKCEHEKAPTEVTSFC